MDGFSKRKKAFETKFSHEEELQFRVTAKRNRMLALWAAGLIGMNETDSKAYAQEIIMLSFEFPEDDQLVKKIHEDLKDAGQDVSERKVLKELDVLHRQAHEVVYKDIKE